MLTLTSITKRFDALVALDNVSLDVRPGEFFGLLGPNGAGKSTLMSLVSGLKSPDSGTIHVAGQEITRDSLAARAGLGFVPQSIALFQELTAAENLRIFGELQGLRGKELTARINDALAVVQLGDRRDSIVKTFSGGMQRRLNLVAALLHRPKLLLCDEPTVGVDPQSRNAIFDFLERLNREGVTVIYSTHYMEEAERLCSRIGVIDHGRILALGTVNELLRELPFQQEVAFPAADTAALQQQLRSHGELAVTNGTARFRPHASFPLSAFYQCAETLGLGPHLFSHQRPTLEAVFLHLTGRNLRDA